MNEQLILILAALPLVLALFIETDSREVLTGLTIGHLANAAAWTLTVSVALLVGVAIWAVTGDSTSTYVPIIAAVSSVGCLFVFTQVNERYERAMAAVHEHDNKRII